MSKRKREDSDPVPHEKIQRKGFSVGPANLPDGTYRRKTQKIKDDLIQKAKVKKEYAKIKSLEETQEDQTTLKYDPYNAVNDPTRPQPAEDVEESNKVESKSNGFNFHPERQAMLDQPEQVPQHSRNKNQYPRKQRPYSNNGQQSAPDDWRERRKNRDIGKPLRYRKDFEQAEQRKAEEEARQVARERRQKERKAMAKARKPGKDGKQKLGRQSNVLLSRVQALMEQG